MELSRHQLSSRLIYQAHVPAFLQKLQNRMAGVLDSPSGEDEPQYEDDEFEYVGDGRPPIPRRPPIPKGPISQPGSSDERRDDDSDEEGDEKPQIIVLREGKHLSEREVKDIKRKGDFTSLNFLKSQKRAYLLFSKPQMLHKGFMMPKYPKKQNIRRNQRLPSLKGFPSLLEKRRRKLPQNEKQFPNRTLIPETILQPR